MLDLLILGAGPAGCAAAIQARRAGLDVMMLDTVERPRPTPGETLHPGIEAIFTTLGIRDAVLAARFHRHRGIWIDWDEPSRFEAYGEDASGPWLGFQADRQRLQGILLDAAVALGAELKRPMEPDALVVEDAGVRGVIVAGRELRARWTADATGRRAWVARQLRLTEDRCSPPLHARFGWRTDYHDQDEEPRLRARPTGWDWRAPLGNGRSAWVAVTVGSQDHAAIAGTDVSWRVHRGSAGPGYFLLGDAAATLDPLSSHGVLRALMGGILCAHRIAANRFHGVTAIEASENFASWMNGQFNHDADALRAIYQRHPDGNVAGLFGPAQAEAQGAI